MKYVKQFYRVVVKDAELKQFIGCSMTEKKIVFIVANKNRVWMELFFEDVLRDPNNFIATPLRIEINLTLKSAVIN